MFVTNEDRIVKSLETIASCMVKSNEMAGEALKKSNELHRANIAMMKESQIGHIPYKIKIIKPIPEVKLNDDAVLSNLMQDLDGT